MEVHILINYLSMLFWIFPLFKQWNTNYRMFFIILALTDPLAKVLYVSFGLYSMVLYAMSFTLAMFSLTKVNKWISISISFLSLLIAFILQSNYILLYIQFFIIDVAIFILIFNHIIRYLLKTGKLNIFLCLLFLYQTINISKIIPILLNDNQPFINFYLGTIVQMLFAALFSLITFTWKDILIIKRNKKLIR